MVNEVNRKQSRQAQRRMGFMVMFGGVLVVVPSLIILGWMALTIVQTGAGEGELVKVIAPTISVILGVKVIQLGRKLLRQSAESTD